MRDFHTPSILLAECAQRARKTKNEYYQKKVEEATSQNIWSFQKWMTANRMYMSPPLDQGENTPLAVIHTEKCDTLRSHLFPTPSHLDDEPEPNMNQDHNNIEYVSVTKREVRDAIFTAAQLNVPGISGLTGRAWRWAWDIMEDAIYNLVRLCADSGYHPKIW